MRRALVVCLAAVALAAPFQPGRAVDVGPDVGMPVWSYDGLGWAAGQNGKLVVIARQGSRHKNDPTGRLVRYQLINGTFVADPVPLIDETMQDERSVAGGFSRSGAMIIWYARQRITMCDPPGSCREPWYENWDGLRAARIVNGKVSSSPIPTGRDGYYSPYGPLVVLPSGRLMQTAYGYNPMDGWRVRSLFSDDDGRTWLDEVVIDVSKRQRPSEAAAAYVAGTTDDTTKLIMIARSQRQNGPHQAYSLMQYISNDGGRHWARRGIVAGSDSPGGAIPWIMKFADGRLALAWVDRGPKTVKVSVAHWQDVFDHPERWPAPRTIYQSRLRDKNNGSDFGYPSIASLGPGDKDKFVVFYDSKTGSSGYPPYDLPSDVDLHAVPLF